MSLIYVSTTRVQSICDNIGGLQKGAHCAGAMQIVDRCEESHVRYVIRHITGQRQPFMWFPFEMDASALYTRWIISVKGATQSDQMTI